MPCFVRVCCFRGRQAVTLGNDFIQLRVLPGGGHIASVQLTEDADDDEAGVSGDKNSPLWNPSWPTCDPSVVALTDNSVFGDSYEGKYVLSHILGHNLCLDVFGAHSKGENEHAGLAFHGEAGQVNWQVTDVQWGEGGAKTGKSLKVTFRAHLSRTMLEVNRTFSLSASSGTVRVEERMKNLVGFERALGRAEHVTLGEAFLKDGAEFHTNADRGQTAKPDDDSPLAAYAGDVSFDYPTIPAATGKAMRDWRCYPHSGMEKSSGLLTLRIRPSDKYGWFTVQNPKWQRRLTYVWDRKAFPWLVTWEENCARDDPPWNGKTLTRGLEFSSYAFPTTRRENVKLGKLHDTPAFEWLDAFEERSTEFFIRYEKVGAGKSEPLSDADLKNVLK